MHVDVVSIRVLSNSLDQIFIDPIDTPTEAICCHIEVYDNPTRYVGSADMNVGSGNRCNILDGDLEANFPLPLIQCNVCRARPIRVARARYFCRTGQVS